MKLSVQYEKTRYQILHCLENLIASGGGVTIVLVETDANRQAPVLSSSYTTLLHCNFINNYFRYKVKLSSLKCAVCALQDLLNPIFLGGAGSELLLNQFIRLLCITM